MPLLYYSTQTKLIYTITTEFYANTFYVYVAEEFNPPNPPNPPSSNPKAVYIFRRLIAENFSNLSDENRRELERYKQTLKWVASLKSKGVVHDKIILKINTAEAKDYMPIIFLIPGQKLKAGRLKPVPADKRPNPHSVEYIIDDLKLEEFDTISEL